MTIICGVLSLDGSAVNPADANAMLDASSFFPHDRRGVAASQRCVLGCLQQYNTPQSPLAAQPVASGDGSLTLVFDGRLDNREDLARELGLECTAKTSGETSDKVSDETLVLAAFQRFGTDLGEHLLGDFAIALHDHAEERLFLIRDHMGVRPLFIARDANRLAFASAKPALLALDWVDHTANDQWIADHLQSCKASFGATAYNGIELLPPAHWLSASPSGVEERKYWQLALNERDLDGSLDDHTRQFRTLLEQAVRCRLRSYTRVASEMSGGLDSTTIASLAGQLLNKDGASIEAFSHVMPPELVGEIHPFKDEAPQIAAVCDKNPAISHNKVFSRECGLVDNLKRASAAHAGPSRSDLTVTGEALLARMQDLGLRTLLSGFGGDQLITSKGVGWEGELVAARDWTELRAEIGQLKIPFHSKIAKYLRHRLPWLSHMEARIFSGGKDDPDDSLIDSAFARAQGYPARSSQFPTRPENGTVREREHAVIHSPHVTYRLADSAIGAASFGVDYRYPLLDIRLLQFCLDLPTRHKRHRGTRRIMIREATKDLLPDMVRLRDDKSGSTIPTVRPRFLHDYDELHAALLRWEAQGELGRYVDVPAARHRLEQVRETKHLNNAASIGELLSVFMLGTWLEQSRASPDVAAVSSADPAHAA